MSWSKIPIAKWFLDFALAIANNLVPIYGSLTNMKSLLTRSEVFMNHKFSINAHKSYTIGLKKMGMKKQLLVMMEPCLKIKTSELTVIGPQGSSYYLGVNFVIGVKS